ncbi:MAG: N-acetylneuraminate synthase family protein [bacterium]|nr:N-acetylneuraminate synthase family protein [bacterium]
MKRIDICGRSIGDGFPPLVIAEIGINHEGDVKRAIRMIDDAAAVGCECVKFQTHIVEDEMIPNTVTPANANETIWEIMKRCALSEADERMLKNYTESKGMIFLSTPFSRAAALRLHSLNVGAFKIGSGECNNYPLVDVIAGLGRPIILSTGMNDIPSIEKAVAILRQHKVPYSLMHCTSVYPTPYEEVRLGALAELGSGFPDAVIGFSDHSMGIYPSLAAIALGAHVVEKHFTSTKDWPGPDIPMSILPDELAQLIDGSRVIFRCNGGRKGVLDAEAATIEFAYACVVAIADIAPGDFLTRANIWVKRPGTGEIKAEHYSDVLGRRAVRRIDKNEQIRWGDTLE